MERWGPEHIEQLAALVGAAAPGEQLTADELLAAVHDDPGVVLAASDGRAAAAGTVRVLDGTPTLVREAPRGAPRRPPGGTRHRARSARPRGVGSWPGRPSGGGRRRALRPVARRRGGPRGPRRHPGGGRLRGRGGPPLGASRTRGAGRPARGGRGAPGRGRCRRGGAARGGGTAPAGVVRRGGPGHRARDLPRGPPTATRWWAWPATRSTGPAGWGRSGWSPSSRGGEWAGPCWPGCAGT